MAAAAVSPAVVVIPGSSQPNRGSCVTGTPGSASIHHSTSAAGVLAARTSDVLGQSLDDPAAMIVAREPGEQGIALAGPGDLQVLEPGEEALDVGRRIGGARNDLAAQFLEERAFQPLHPDVLVESALPAGGGKAWGQASMIPVREGALKARVEEL